MGENYDYLGGADLGAYQLAGVDHHLRRTAYGGRAERHIPETVQQKKCEGFGLGFALYKQCVYANRRTSGLLF